MKSKLLLLLLLSAFGGLSVNAQSPLAKQWDYRFGGTSDDYLFSFHQTADGGYILGGASASGISGDKTQTTQGGSDYWIVKTNSLGIKQWDKRFGGTSEDYLFFMQQTADGGYILGGTSSSGIGGDKSQATQGGNDYWIVKTDVLGVKQWDKDFGGAGEDFLYSLQQTSDGGYILGGYSNSGISGDKTLATQGGNDYWVVKTNSLGVKQWDKDFGGTGEDFLASLQQTADGGFILGGFSYSGISGDKSQANWGISDYWLVKTNSLGIKQWDKDFGGTSSDALYSLQQTTDGGFILGGTSSSGISGDKTQTTWGLSDYWIVKTNSLGVKQWDKDFGGTSAEDDFGNISQTSDGGYLIPGNSYSPISGNKTESNLGTEQSWVLKTDSLGIKKWDKTLHTNATIHDETAFAIQTSDGCFAMANGTTGGIAGDKIQANWDVTNATKDFWIIKFCDTGLTGIHELGAESLKFVVFPNPFTNEIKISSSGNSSSKGEIILFDVMGKEILRQYISSEETILNTSKISAGFYLLYYSDGKQTENFKVVKL